MSFKQYMLEATPYGPEHEEEDEVYSLTGFKNKFNVELTRANLENGIKVYFIILVSLEIANLTFSKNCETYNFTRYTKRVVHIDKRVVEYLKRLGANYIVSYANIVTAIYFTDKRLPFYDGQETLQL